MNKAFLFKIKEGKKEIWYSWCNELATTLKEEALATLKEEGLVHEMALAFNTPEGEYFIGYMDGDGLPADMSKEINQKHKLMKDECLEKTGPVDVLYSLKT